MKEIKDTIAGLVYRIIVLLVRLLPGGRLQQDHLLIIKTDEIGDYILFRNHLKHIRNSDKYRNHKITIVGNSAWQPVFNRYDAEFADDVIWINKKRFNRDLVYRFGVFRAVRQLATTEVLNCIFSRSFKLDDGFAFVATGKTKIAMKGNNANRPKFAPNIDAAIYTRIIEAGNERMFETVRNSNYISIVLGLKGLPIDCRFPFIGNYPVPNQNYFTIFVGAGNKEERRWPIENFVKCVKYIVGKYGLFPIVCGGPGDEAYAAEFVNKYGGSVLNLAGKTTIPEFIDLSARARLLLSVDTGPVHMAAAAGGTVVALFSGVYYKRYAPYPKETSPTFYSVFADFVDKMIENDDERLYDPFKMENTNIRKIQPEKLFPYFDLIMNSEQLLMSSSS